MGGRRRGRHAIGPGLLVDPGAQDGDAQSPGPHRQFRALDYLTLARGHTLTPEPRDRQNGFRSAGIGTIEKLIAGVTPE